MAEIITREEAAALLVDATPRSCPKCKGRGYIANYPQDSRFCDACDASGGLRGNEVVASLASTVVALHDRIADLEATLASERDRAVSGLPSWEEQALAALAAREAARVADPALKVGHLRAVIVEPATACPNDASRSAACADPESCAKHGCGYLESLGDGEVKL